MIARPSEPPTLPHGSILDSSSGHKSADFVRPEDTTDDFLCNSDFRCRSRAHCLAPPKLTLNESVKFALRVSISLTLASLFTLCFSADEEIFFPDAVWVYVTAGVVSWQPTPDTGSVFKKAWERSLGTVLGGLVGLSVGAVSLIFPEHGSSEQAMYIGISNTVVSFLIVYCTCEHGLRAHYSSVLGTFTFGIALLAFYSVEANTAWRVATFRIVNIVVGGLIGSLVSLVIFPTSTRHLVEWKVSDAKTQAGATALEVFASLEDGLPSFKNLIQDEEVEDPGHAAYKKGIADIQTVKGLFPLLDFDPFYLAMTPRRRKEMLELWRVKLGRTMRIQMNIMCLDNIVRSKLIGHDTLKYGLLRRIGKNIADLLNDSRTHEDRDQNAFEMLNDDLPAVREEIACHKGSASVIAVDRPSLTVDEMMSTLSSFDEASTTNLVKLFSMNQTVLFYQMVEVLIIRCIRLHHV
ncbi:aluminum activated malate transporter [Nitzschia inconspicua]|uniref:Aluminum activated malate transporter n=1 Tax=Nitzschia inconspicua TaxID=303405 RepID=A0A9K3LLG2_9STRA|nr:aluminum activated malate transporter [Nitzschia inconspicua]